MNIGVETMRRGYTAMRISPDGESCRTRYGVEGPLLGSVRPELTHSPEDVISPLALDRSAESRSGSYDDALLVYTAGENRGRVVYESASRAVESIPLPDGLATDISTYRSDLAEGTYGTRLTVELAYNMQDALAAYVRYGYDVGRAATSVKRSRARTIQLINSELLLRRSCAKRGSSGPDPATANRPPKRRGTPRPFDHGSFYDR